MTYQHVITYLRSSKSIIVFALAILCLLIIAGPARGDTPITLYRSFAGNINVIATGATLRTQPNTGNACLVTNGPVTMPLSGIPAGSTITAAYLYWAGSGSVIDSNVTFNGNSVNADRTFTATTIITGTTYNFFSGFKDVTPYVTGNGNYTFTNLAVDTSATYCGVSAVLSGAALIVIYSNAAEDFRVINAWDGFQIFYNSSITLTPTNFRVPTTPINGKHLVVTWEGDPNITGNENINFNGVNLSDALNTAGSLWNSTINTIPSSVTYGVDTDAFSVSSYLTAGDASATAIYSTGGDLVILSTQVMSVTNVPVADLAITKSHAGNFTVGTNGTYTIGVSNNGPNDATGTITVTDTLPAGLTYVSATGTGWTCGAVGQTVTCTRPGPLANGASSPVITLTVSIGVAAYPGVTNMVTATSNAFDNNPSNSATSDPATVLAPNLSTSTKTVLDVNGGDANPGDVLRYTLTLNETGNVNAAGVVAIDNVPANITGFTVVNIPAGSTNSSTGSGTGANGTGYLNITNISIPANGSVTIIFEVTVGAVPLGTLINNTATIMNPLGPGASPVAPAIIVSQSSVPTTGNKQLYLYGGAASPYQMSRTPTPGAPTTAAIAAQGGSANWNGNNPVALQRNVTITAASATLYINGSSNSARNIEVRLYCSSNAAAYAYWGPANLPTNPPVPPALPTAYTFNLTNVAGGFTFPATCNATNYWVLQVFNRTATAGLTITLVPVSGTNRSNLNLASNNVINVDSLTAYSAAYPGATIPPFFGNGSSVHMRAVVSDPFGSFDINANPPATIPQIVIRDSNNNVIVPSTAMTQVADSGTATKTFEFAYTPVPAPGPPGFWTATVTAPEGTEGTVSDSGVGTFRVILQPNLIVLKAAQILSDPVNGTTNPKAIPGAVILYTITVTNSGTGAVDSNAVVLTDLIPPNTTMSVDTGAGNPVTFTCSGTPPCGLTWDYATAVSYSSQPGGGAPYNYTPGTTGYDPLVTGIRVNPAGTLNGNNANVTLQFKVRVN